MKTLVSRYNVQGEMECCKTDLCNTLEISPVSSASNSTHPDRNYVSGCSKRFRLNGTESLVPSHFIAMNDDLTPPMEPVSLELRKKRETINTQTGEGSRAKRDINQPGATLTSNQSQVCNIGTHLRCSTAHKNTYKYSLTVQYSTVKYI